jgi:Flp pilus assembly protein TadG
MIAPRPLALWLIARNREGTAAVEFAFILPLLLTLFLGSYELTNVLLADLKLTAATETAADLIAQTRTNVVLKSKTPFPNDFDNITSAAIQVLTPLPTGSNRLKIAYASVTYNTGTPVIDWHVEKNGASPISISSFSGSQALTLLGNATPGSSDSVILVQAQYSYTSPISYVLRSNYTLSKVAFNRPRYVGCVPTDLNTNNVCP